MSNTIRDVWDFHESRKDKVIPKTKLGTEQGGVDKFSR